VLFAAVINALIVGFVGKKKNIIQKDLRVSLFTLIVFSHTITFLGLILYFVSPMFDL
jgi:hypothetical protein